MHDVDHVGREGGQRLLDGLLVADIGKHIVKDRKLRAQQRRNLKSRLHHQRKQADGLEGDGLAAGVGAGHNKRRKILADPKIARHHLIRVDQRMPPAFNVDKAVVVDFGLHGAHLPRQRALGKDKVQFRQNPLIFKQRTRLTGY